MIVPASQPDNLECNERWRRPAGRPVGLVLPQVHRPVYLSSWTGDRHEIRKHDVSYSKSNTVLFDRSIQTAPPGTQIDSAIEPLPPPSKPILDANKQNTCFDRLWLARNQHTRGTAKFASHFWSRRCETSASDTHHHRQAGQSAGTGPQQSKRAHAFTFHLPNC
jgi:hypothetical protein